MNQTELMHILSDGQFHSGEDIGAALGVPDAVTYEGK